MAANTTPISPVAPSAEWGFTVATLTARTNITGTTGITQVTATSTNGKRVDRIIVHAAATTALAKVFIWLYNGTTSGLLYEIDIPALTPDTVTAAAHIELATPNCYLGPNDQLYASTTIAQNTNVCAFSGKY